VTSPTRREGGEREGARARCRFEKRRGVREGERAREGRRARGRSRKPAPEASGHGTRQTLAAVDRRLRPW